MKVVQDRLGIVYHVAFHAEDGLYSGLLGLEVKLGNRLHDAVVRYGDGVMVPLFQGLDKVFGLDHRIQGAHLGVKVKLDSFDGSVVLSSRKARSDDIPRHQDILLQPRIGLHLSPDGYFVTVFEPGGEVFRIFTRDPHAERIGVICEVEHEDREAVVPELEPENFSADYQVALVAYYLAHSSGNGLYFPAKQDSLHDRRLGFRLFFDFSLKDNGFCESLRFGFWHLLKSYLERDRGSGDLFYRHTNIGLL